MSHAHLSWFSNLVGGSAKLTGLPCDWAIFAWHVVSIFLLLFAAWRLLGVCFRNGHAQWSGVTLLAAALSVPVAGTALVIMDPYLTARSLSTPLTVLAIAYFVSNRMKAALGCLLLTALVHPQMSVFCGLFLACLVLVRRHWRRQPTDPAPAFTFLSALPFLFRFTPAQGPAREVLFSRTYFFVSNWAWYEWIGVFAPLALLAWFASFRPKGTTPAFRLLTRALVPFGLIATVGGLFLSFSARLENYTRLQPMRCFHLIYVVFFILLGGMIGEYALRTHAWRWLSLFLPVIVSMWLVQRSSFPASPHLELPGTGNRNSWISAFVWIRDHTPKTAVFGVDPNYMTSPGEDEHGFRAIAERSVLADNIKDSGAVSVFPELAEDWKQQTDATRGWKNFELADFEKLARQFPVTWILTRRPRPTGLTCPYENRDMAVCKIPAGRAVAGVGKYRE